MNSLNVLFLVCENMSDLVCYFLNDIWTAKVGSNSYNQGDAPLYFPLLCQSPFLQLPMVNLSNLFCWGSFDETLNLIFLFDSLLINNCSWFWYGLGSAIFFYDNSTVEFLKSYSLIVWHCKLASVELLGVLWAFKSTL